MGFKVKLQLPSSGFLVLGFIALLIVSCSRQSPNVETVTISNVEPRRDVNGQIIDAHGGCLQFFNGLFYLYGNTFGTNQNDTFTNCPFSVYSSPNLMDWKLEGTLLKDMPRGFYYRPYVVFNPKTKKYVLWYDWYQTLWKGQDGVAVSDSPVGPFTIVTPRAHLSGSSSGDGSLFVDNDGTGYFVYTDIANNYTVRIERLTPDFLDSSGKTSPMIATGAEAPLMIHRNNLYYVLCGPLCAYCANGAEVHVFMSTSPLGPFYTSPAFSINTAVINAGLAVSGLNNSTNKDPQAPNALKGTNAPPSPATSPMLHAQETWIAQIPAAGDSLYIWMADRWHDNPDGLIAHDLQYWIPMSFSTNGEILPLKKVSKWSINWSVNP